MNLSFNPSVTTVIYLQATQQLSSIWVTQPSSNPPWHCTISSWNPVKSPFSHGFPRCFHGFQRVFQRTFPWPSQSGDTSTRLSRGKLLPIGNLWIDLRNKTGQCCCLALGCLFVSFRFLFVVLGCLCLFALFCFFFPKMLLTVFFLGEGNWTIQCTCTYRWETCHTVCWCDEQNTAAFLENMCKSLQVNIVPIFCCSARKISIVKTLLEIKATTMNFGQCRYQK